MSQQIKLGYYFAKFKVTQQSTPVIVEVVDYFGKPNITVTGIDTLYGLNEWELIHPIPNHEKIIELENFFNAFNYKFNL